MDFLSEKASTAIIAAKRRPLNFLAAIVLVGFLIFAVRNGSLDTSSYHTSTIPIVPIPDSVPITIPTIPVVEDGPLLPDATNPGTVKHSPGRENDVKDAFADYVRQPDSCFLSSLELHEPFSPLCPDKSSFLQAAGWGGRAGVDAPYKPRSCDMRWFLTDEICDIMSRFSHIWVVGDSMMRNTAVALHVLLRADLNEGPAAQWTQPPEDLNCRCRGPFETAACMWYVAFSSSDVWKNVPAGLPHSIKCPKDNMAMIEYIPQTAYPINDTIHGLTDRLPKEKPTKPQAFIVGHGVWNSLNETASSLWLDEVEEGINTTNTWLPQPDALYPRLFITPNAAGDNKPVQYQETQGNIALHRFEINMAAILKGRGVDHLGMYNATIQNTTPDGTHAGMRSNLLKAMFIFNWLNFLEVERN